MCDECAHKIRNTLAKLGGMLYAVRLETDDVLISRGLNRIQAEINTLSVWINKRCEGCNGCDKGKKE